MSAADFDPVALYRDWSKTSGRLHEEARGFLPGGDTRASAHFAPYPLEIEFAEGCRMWDVDGHELIDFMNNFTSLIHGHGQPDVVAAVQHQIARGSAYAAPIQSQIDLAELLCSRIPSLELMRFCSSGSEATLMALRCARAVTGRQRIMKMEGGYHGSYEAAEVSLLPLPGRCGEETAPISLPIDDSIPESTLHDVIACPFNEPDLAASLIKEHAPELAAVIVEPILGSMGMIPARRDFLKSLREATERTGVILIFDEVISLRLGDGGAQSTHDIVPDLTALGKIIGGGLPIGAIGGRRDLMARFDPESPRPIFHASTFSGNPISMAAGLASMKALDSRTRTRLDELGEALRRRFNRTFQEMGIRGQALGEGSLTNLHLTSERIENARQSVAAMLAAGPLANALHLGMLRHGITSASRLMYCTSSAMGEREIELASEALAATLGELKPWIEKTRPALLA